MERASSNTGISDNLPSEKQTAPEKTAYAEPLEVESGKSPAPTEPTTSETSEEPVPTGPRSLRTFATLVSGFSAGLDFMMVLAVMPAIAEVYDNQNIFVGILVFCKYLTQMCTNPFAAYSVYRLGPWPTGIIGLFIYGCATFVFALTSELFPILCVTMVCQGIGAALLFNGTQEAMLRHYPADMQGDAVSYGMIGLSLGLFLGPIYGGVMYDAVGFVWAFLIVSIGFFTLLVGACICYRYAIEYKIPGPAYDPEKKEQQTEREFLGNFLKDNYKTITTNRRLLLIFFTFILESILWGTIMNVETFYLERHGWSASATGLMLSIVSFFYGVVSFFSGYIYKHHRWFIIWSPYPSLIFLGIFVPFVGLTTSIGALLFINFVCGTLIGIVELTAIYNFRILLNDSPIAFSLTDVCFCFGGLTGALLGTALNDVMPSTFAALLLLGMIAFCAGFPLSYLAWLYYSEDGKAREKKLQEEANKLKKDKSQVGRSTSNIDGGPGKSPLHDSLL